MKSESAESGLDALMRLSRQTAAQAKNLAEVEKQRREQRDKSQNVRQGLREISISVAVKQLKLVAPDNVIKRVQSLANKPDVKDLRKMVSDSVHDLEKQTGRIAGNADMGKIRNSAKALAILIELYFALSD
jgi:hypothetical protein